MLTDNKNMYYILIEAIIFESAEIGLQKDTIHYFHKTVLCSMV